LPASDLPALPLPQPIQIEGLMLLNDSGRKFIVLLLVTLVLMGFSACSKSEFLCTVYYSCCLKLGPEAAAISSLRTIHNAQAQYQEKHNRFGTLKKLAEAGLISANFANGQAISGYQYSDLEASAESYSVQATRIMQNRWFGLSSKPSAARDFMICEDGEIRAQERETPRKLQRGEGQLITQSSPPPFQ
jgi:hypothetical protein